MFPIHEWDKRRNDRKSCRSFAAFLALVLVLFSVLFNGMLLLPQSFAAEEDSDRAPYVVDWGLFDEETGEQISLMESGVIEGDTSGMVFYIRFDHNVAQRDGGDNVADPNCSLISVVSNGGKPVASTAWVKDTQLEFQYRQYIFITVTGTFDPTKYYHIAVAPGITAKNGFTNNGGTDLYFSFPTSGAGEDPVPLEEPAVNTDHETEGTVSGSEKTGNEKNPEKELKKPTAPVHHTESRSSQGSQKYNSGPQTANKPTVGNGTQLPLQQKPDAALQIYQLDAGLFDHTAEEAAAEEQKADDLTDTNGMDARSMIAFSVMILLCLLMVAAGAAFEALSFRYRLRHR